MTWRGTLYLFALLAFLAAAPCSVRAETLLDVDAGWGWRPRSERWAPINITASDPKTRNVLLDVQWPVGGNYSMRIQQAMTIDASPRTFQILAPMHGWSFQQAGLTLIDRDTGKTLAHYPKDPDQNFAAAGVASGMSGRFVGVSGAATQLYSLENAGMHVSAAFLEPRRLPTTPIGFDTLEILVLNAPNLGRASFGPAALTDVQQQAIVDWVKAGGNLLLWPGDAGFPSTGPLASEMPARLGVRENIALTPADLHAIGLPERFKNLPAYHIEPKPGANRRPMLNSGQVSAYAIRRGLGMIVLSPVNVGELPVDNNMENSRKLWLPLMTGLVTSRPGEIVSDNASADTAADEIPASASPTTNPYYNGEDDDNSREQNASMQIADYLGDVANAGQVSFSYVAFMLIGSMLVVGPIDWLVLKKLGRQPWTWITTSGWIVLVTTAALLAGYLFKSGDLHYRTLEAVDQAGDSTVASTDYVALYSSRTRSYEIKTGDDGWWQPTGFSEYGGSGLKLDIDFHQTGEGNTPEDMVVNVWSLRFLRGDRLGPGAPLLMADLRRVPGDSNSAGRIAGNIRNLSGSPLKIVRIAARGGEGAAVVGASPNSTTMPATPTTSSTTDPSGMIASDAQAAVEVDLSPVAHQAPVVNQPYYGPRYRYYEHKPVENESELWEAVENLNWRRSSRMKAMIATGKYAVVYAQAETTHPSAALVGQNAIEHHWKFIRALVELHDREGK